MSAIRSSGKLVDRKAIFVNRYYFPDESATSQMLTGVARGLAAHTPNALGIDVHVVTSRQLYQAPEARLTKYELIDGVQVHRVWTSRFGRGRLVGRALDYASFYVTAAIRLWRLVRRGDVVIAKTDPPMISIVCACIATLRGAKLVNWLQDIFPEVASRLGQNPLPRLANHFLLRVRDRSLRVAKRNVVLGERMREHLLSRAIAVEQVQIIENWADGELLEPHSAESTRLRHEQALQGKFVVMYSGNLGRAHEYGTMLQAALILARNVDIVFLVIGGGAGMQPLRVAVEHHQLRNFVFLPYQPYQHLADSLAAADVHIISLLPALEGLIVPSKFYGILAVGRPAIFIGDRDGELARRIGDGRCGQTVANGDGASLANKIEDMKQNPGQAREQGLRARELFERQYTLARTTDKWRQLLLSV